MAIFAITNANDEVTDYHMVAMYAVMRQFDAFVLFAIHKGTLK